jgi:GNAT superfamily N-acetyltransferase
MIAADIHIRLADLSDIPHIQALFRDTVLQVNVRDYTDEQVSVWALQAELDHLWIEKLSETHVLLAILDGRLAGFGTLTIDCNIEMLYTAVDAQGRGVATRLLAELEAEARRRGYYWLVTDASLTARRVFERNGFELVREQTVELRGAPFTNYKMMKAL